MEQKDNQLNLLPEGVRDYIITKMYDRDLVYAEKCKKYNRFNIQQDRVIVLSERFFYLTSPKKIHSKMLISELIYSIKAISNNHSSTKEIILCYTSDQEGGIVDIRMSVCNCDSFFQQLKHLYAKQMQVEKLKGFRIYGVPSSNLSNYRFTKHQFNVEPDSKYRIVKEELELQKFVKDKQIEQKKPEQVIQQTENVENDDDQHPENFKFENRMSLKQKRTKNVVPVINIDFSKMNINAKQDNQLFETQPDFYHDNLQEHLNDLKKADALSKQNQAIESHEGNDEQFFLQQQHKFNQTNQEAHEGNPEKRRLTLEEKNEFKGTSLLKRKTQKQEDENEVDFKDFNMIMVLGRGAFGKVFLAELIKTKQLFAVKSIRKDILIDLNQIESTILEKDILFECDHPFLVGMEYMFQNETRVYFVMPFIRGGELYKIYQQKKRFNEKTVKFYSAQIALAVGYLHSKDIVHRDLKLENILVDQTGYLKIIDYGLAKILKDDQESMSFCGTPEYLAPEMVSNEGHDKAVDWWALGVLMYEMLIGVTPFFNKNKSVLLQKIQTTSVVFPDRKKYKIDYSDELMDLILRLLDKNKSTRLGSGKQDYRDILKHPFFSDLDIKQLQEQTLNPPYKPNIDNQDFSKYFNLESSKKQIEDTYVPKEQIEKINQNQDAFEQFNLKSKKKN